jgi:cyclophilin family peptidyl-prolyl cis-trans isomerase/HEAT repeat protein
VSGALVLAALLAAPAPPPALSRVEKMARILSLEDRRSVGAGALDRFLRDPDRSIRRRAAFAAGRIGDASLVPTLVELMNDQEPEVRQMSAFAMGLIGDRLAFDRLVASLKDSDSVVRARSAEALGRLGDPRAAPEVAKMVLAALPKQAGLLTVRGDDPGSATDPWLEMRLGLFALARLKDAKTAESVLVAAGKPRFDWWAAAWTAMRIENAALRPALVGAATSTDALSRAFAARGLGALKDASALDTLAELARDADETVAVSALRAIGAIGDARGVAPVAAHLGNTNLTLVTEALRALATLPADPRLRARVVPYLGHEDVAVRAAAFPALVRTDRDEFALVLSGLDPDRSWFVRASLATALGDAGDEVSQGILFTMLKDEDVRVLPAVLEALRKARGTDAADTLRRHLEHRDFAVRAAAVENLAALKLPGQTAAFAAAYKSWLGDADIDARLAIVVALAALSEPDAVAALTTAAREDPSRAVRERAAAALKGKGGEAPDPGPEVVDRPMLDYAALMAPYEPVAGVPLYTPRAFVHTRRGKFEIHLNIVEAPLATSSFMELARRGFYNGLVFHRVVPGFVIQGGCPRGDGNGGPGYTRRCEVGQRPYGRGTVGIALSGKDTGGSQFFVTHLPTPHLDGAYTVLGWVASGMEVVDQIRPGDVIEGIEIWTGQ